MEIITQQMQSMGFPGIFFLSDYLQNFINHKATNAHLETSKELDQEFYTF